MNRPTLFPRRFNPTLWGGPRRQQYSDRSDAFQQLVGDALREQFGSRASVSPTEGRDGSIDVFIDADRSGSHAFIELPSPQIVECKDHDDTLDGYLTNIAAGWSKVAEKLKKQAAGGWPGHFKPWQRARSYVYCVSAVLPNQEERDKLHRSITGFFENLPAAQRPPLEEIRVLDWADLRDLLDRLPRVADRWLGTGLPLLPGHAEYCASLTRFRRYLLDRHLPFIAPPAEGKTHPRNILARVEALAGTGGVLIKGVGGAGKTRTTLEVAHLAEKMGWRVLHVLPGEPGVTIDDLSAAVFTGQDRTLLVFDYIDQMPRLDLGSLRQRLLPEAEKRGVCIALLANLRPSSLRRPNAERDAIFTENILLQPTANQKALITERVLDRIAPTAVAQLGRDRVNELCGERPIIAMFVAAELERRASIGSLAQEAMTGLRNGDLLGWLRRRLAEDKLVVGDSTGFLPPRPEPSLVSAAAMLAAAPMSKDPLMEAGAAACDAAGGNGTAMAAQVLEGLLSLGWLEPRDAELAAAHDVVADEVLAQVLWERATEQLRDAVLPWCLAPALNRARVLGRYATAFTRLLGPTGAETEKEAVLREHLGRWLQSNSRRLGEMFASADVGETAYALGGVVSTPVWAEVCIAEWTHLIAPWLARNGTHPETRHLLYRGLKEFRPGAASELLVAALNWLPHHQRDVSASYVLGPLLARADLGTHATRAVDLAMQWLETFPRSLDAQFVFNPLLARSDLGTHATRAVDLAMQWLEAFPRSMEAGFVLPPLLARTDLGTHAARAVDLAMQWLEAFPRSLEAGFVLPPLLARTDLGTHATHATRAVDLAMQWLEAFPRSLDAGFVFDPLLARTDLGTHATRAVDLAMQWLQVFPLIQDAGFVLTRLFGRHDLSKTQRKLCATIALPQLERLGTAPEASYLLKGCLRDRELDEESARLVVDYALAWLKNNPLNEGADYVFNRLLARPDLQDDDWKEISGIALAWLHHHATPDNRDLSLAALLRRPGHLTKQDLDWVTKAAKTWLAHRPKDAHSPDKLLTALDFARLNPGSTGGRKNTERIDESIAEQLKLAARGQAAMPSPQEIEASMNHMAIALDTSRPAPASHILSSLLVIVQPATQPGPWTKLIALARRILAHPRFLPHHRAGLARTLWQFVDRGAWPEEIARPVLEDLDLPRPDNRTR